MRRIQNLCGNNHPLNHLPNDGSIRDRTPFGEANATIVDLTSSGHARPEGLCELHTGFRNRGVREQLLTITLVAINGGHQSLTDAHSTNAQSLGCTARKGPLDLCDQVCASCTRHGIGPKLNGYTIHDAFKSHRVFRCLSLPKRKLMGHLSDEQEVFFMSLGHGLEQPNSAGSQHNSQHQ